MQNREMGLRRLLAASLVMSVTMLACSDDNNNSAQDASNIPGDGGGSDAVAVDGLLGDASVGDAINGDASIELLDCTGKVDGTACGTGSVCLAAVCVTSSCGDGFVDVALGEECEDNNAMSGDGCGLCRWECTADAACDDGNACNGAETCTLATHICAAGTAVANGTACMRDAATAGVCNNQACVAAGCGNSVTDAGEQCDDGNADDEDGCTRACKFTCSGNDDCNDGNACNGAETCNVGTHTCVAGVAVTCMANGCAGTCNSQTGACSYPDVDKDGSSCDVDCKDADPAVFPGGYECADGKDNDCNPATQDVGSPSCQCYVDKDKDGFAASVIGAIASSGACPAEYTYTKPVDIKTTDCAAGVPSAYPGQRSYFPTAYCKPNVLQLSPAVIAPVVLPPFCFGTWSYDYNCDGMETSTVAEDSIAAATCAGALRSTCRGRSGWITTKPACGKPGTFRECTYANGTCSGTDTAGRIRSCR